MNHTLSHPAASHSRPSENSADPIAEELRRYDEHLRDVRGLAAGTRHGRLGVIRWFLRDEFAGRAVDIAALRPDDVRRFLKFAAHRDVASLQVIERALGVPVKRFERPMFGYLSREEMLAVIGTPGKSWLSQRDHVLFLLMYNTGARVSEIIGITVGEVVLDEGAACVHLHGKGRKQRSVPLWRSTVRALRDWLRLNPQFEMASPLLPNHNGSQMTRSNVTKRLALAVQAASASVPGLSTRRISPHTIRHTTAMHLLQAGVDVSVIALWLGHESPVTTHHYVEADLTMKERALARLREPDAQVLRYRAPDSLIAFLRAL